MGGDRPRRTRSIQRMLVSLLVVPIVALVALWLFAATVTVEDSLRLVRSRTFDAQAVRPTEALVAELQHERRMSMAFLGEDPTIGEVGFKAQRDRTDKAREAFVAASKSGDLNQAATEETRRRMRALAARLSELEGLRREVDDAVSGRPVVLARYTELITEAGRISVSERPGDDHTSGDGHMLRDLQTARESISYEDALITGALTRKVPDKAEQLEFVREVGAHRSRYDEIAGTLEPQYREGFDRLTRSPAWKEFKALEDELAVSLNTVDSGRWHAGSEAVLNELTAFEDEVRHHVSEHNREHAQTILTRLGLAGGAGLLAVIFAITVGIRLVRRLVRENRRMVKTVEEFANERLPSIPELVQQGHEIELDGTPQDFSVREVAQVYDAFAEARRAVVRATVSEAAARRGLGEVFVNLARRNQVLLQRLLRLLDGMERQAKSPDELTDLFAIDHLVTRMRRHAEGLVILAGRSAGRTWRRPVPVVDIVRAAVAEVEEYQRVKVPPLAETMALSGAVAADVIHLLAELVENATMFSPPELRVQVTGQMVAHGLAIEVEDRGLGLDEEKLAMLNQTLAEAPDFDLFDSARLGLFVVARLAKRHDIKVMLRPSPYGGTTAIALIPSALLVAADDIMPEPVQETRPRVKAQTAQPVHLVEAVEVEDGELPQRTRQRSLAPGLRDRQDTSDSVGPRPPEEARTVLTAMQQGWQRGRQEASTQEEDVHEQ